MAATDSDDEDLKAAIAMSLAEATSHGPQSIPVDGSSDTPSLVTATTSSTTSSNSSIVGFAGMDRKAMEQERLARLQSRKRGPERSISPPLSGSRKAPKLESSTVALPSGARLRTFSTLVNEEQNQRKPAAALEANQRLKQEPKTRPGIKPEPKDEPSQLAAVPLASSIQYPNGIVKKTWAFGFERDGKDVKIEEVLEPATLRTAVLSAFQWDMEWVMSKLRTAANGRGTTKCVFVMQAKEKELRQQMLEDTQEYRSYLRLCFPPMEGLVNCMHSKLMLLFHADKLRIAIPTANLLKFDWGETGVMENSVFMIDLPRLPEGVKEDNSLTAFGKSLLSFLEKQGMDQDIRDGLRNFDFTATQNIAFLHTVGGMNYGDDAEHTGLPGLAESVRDLNLRTTDNLQIDFAASSIGSLNDEFLRTVHSAARGEDIIGLSQAATTKAKADFFKKPSASASKQQTTFAGLEIREKLRIYFPTHETVTSSKAGAAGTICLSRKWFEASTFPRSCFRDYRSTRAGLLSHNKILYARGKQLVQDGSSFETAKDIAWVYVGSANMSKSAWGEVFYDKKNKAWKVNCRNWECGVLLPVSEKSLQSSIANGSGGPVKKEEVENGEDSETDVEADEPASKKKVKVEGEDSETESEDESGAAGAQKVDLKVPEMSVFDGVVPPPFKVPADRVAA